MNLSEVVRRIERVVATCGSPDATPADVRTALSAATQLESFIAARRSELIRALDSIPGAFPEAAIADTSGCSLSDAAKEKARADTLDSATAFADALDDGRITPGHVDALTRAGRRLGDAQRATLLEGDDALAAAASTRTVAQFSEFVTKRARALDTDDAVERLERQQRASRLRTWTDDDGMWNLRGRFDPLLGTSLARRIEAATNAKFAEDAPETAPSDPIERQQHLRALALANIIEGTAPAGTGAGAPIVVIDATQTDGGGGPVIDWGIPIELPRQVLDDILGVRDPDVVVVANGIILHAPGTLDLGRTTRLANRAQRRALRGLYSTCAVPGCSVHYDRCKLHHITWWRHGGRTDLDNLLPVCAHHHSKIHADNWSITLSANREMSIALPDGQVMRTGPPKRRAA